MEARRRKGRFPGDVLMIDKVIHKHLDKIDEKEAELDLRVEQAL